MTEPNQQPANAPVEGQETSPDDIAAALAADPVANAKRLNEEDALAVLASGQDTVQDDPAEAFAQAGGEGQAPADGGIPFQDAPANGAAASATFTSSSTPPRSNAVRQAAMARVHAQNFKKTAIPMLTVVGGLLVLMSGAVILLTKLDMLRDNPNSFLDQHKWILVLTALPLGAILLLGAWLFQREITESQKKSR